MGEFSKSAESAGELYSKKASTMPTEGEQHKLIMVEDAQTLGSIDGAIAAEIAADVAAEHGTCGECARDYSELCPMHWSQVSGGMCLAPASYDGVCQAAAFFSKMSSGDKTNYEKRCSVCWPCSTQHAEVSPAPPCGPVRR